MRKEYISPQIIVLDVVAEPLLAASTFEVMEGEDVSIWPDEGMSPDKAMSKERNSFDVWE